MLRAATRNRHYAMRRIDLQGLFKCHVPVAIGVKLPRYRQRSGYMAEGGRDRLATLILANIHAERSAHLRGLLAIRQETLHSSR